MNDIIEQVKRLSFDIIDKYYFVDVFNNVISIYNFEYEQFNMIEKKELNIFLEEAKLYIANEHISSYLNMFSIPKIKQNIDNKKNVVSINYETLNHESKKLFAFLSKDEQKILLFEINVSYKQSMENDFKYNKLVENICDSLVKITNSFNIKENTDIKSVEEYINSVIYSLSSNNIDIKKSLNKTHGYVSSLSKKTILIVDDDILTRNMIKKIFSSTDEYNIVMLSNGMEAINYFEAQQSKNIVEEKDNVIGIFLDLLMPVVDGFGVLDYLSQNNYLSKIPVIIISGDYDKDVKQKVYNYNIADMLEKPFDFEIVKHRINKFIDLYNSSNALFNLVSSQNSDINSIIDVFLKAYFYDYEEKIKKVRDVIYKVGIELIKLNPSIMDESKLNMIKKAVKYYDVGVYSIPKIILLRKVNIADRQLEFIKNYPDVSSSLVSYILQNKTDDLYKKYAYNIAKYYNENYDGTGYPKGLKEKEIPFEAQLAKIAIMYVNDNSTYNIINTKTINPILIEAFKKAI